MERFCELFRQLDATTATNEKVAALAAYFGEAEAEDAAHALYLLTGRRRKRLITARTLRQICLEDTGLPEWLFQDSYAHVGDTAETIALLMAAHQGEPTQTQPPQSLTWWVEQIIALGPQDDDARAARIRAWWSQIPTRHVFILNKIMTGGFRVGVSQKLVIRALAKAHKIEETTLADRLMGDWEPTPDYYQSLIDTEDGERHPGRPYPFFLASPLESPLEELGPAEHWRAEWKWDGIRAQLIRRDDRVFLWSRGEELMTDRFPEITEAIGEKLPNGTVMDGEILTWKDNGPLPFALLQKRIGRKKLSAKILEEAPVIFMAYDLMEWADEDIRTQPFDARIAKLSALIAQLNLNDLRLSPPIVFGEWPALEELRQDARTRSVEGLMIKRGQAPYRGGRKRGDWWKYKVDPFTLDAVLIYAQAGSGRRANLFTDYTFALWRDDTLVPFAKAYSGLDNKEISALDRWIRRNTLERFGPVRSVEPIHVFEIAFEGIAASSRHKSGIAVRFPRIHRWRKDKTAQEADRLETAKALIS